MNNEREPRQCVLCVYMAIVAFFIASMIVLAYMQQEQAIRAYELRWQDCNVSCEVCEYER